VVTYVPYGPSAETPDEVGTNGGLEGFNLSARRAQAASRSFPSSLLEPQFDRASDLCRALRAAPAFSWSISVNRLLQCGVDAGIAAYVCCQIAAENGRRPFVRTLKLVIRGSGLLR
jgi:hypothetical protein